MTINLIRKVRPLSSSIKALRQKKYEDNGYFEIYPKKVEPLTQL